MRRVPLILTAFICVVLATAAIANDLKYTAQFKNTVLKYFELIAFGREHGNESNHIIKWVIPIRIFIANPSDRLLKQVQIHVKQLRGLSNLDIELVEDKEKANYFIFHLSSADINKLMKKYVFNTAKSKTRHTIKCSGVNTVFESEIKESIITIPNDITTAEMEGCVIEEMTQSLGLANDSFEAHKSIFNDDNIHTQLTEYDKLLVEILYDPRIRPGMKKRKALSVAKKIVESNPDQN